MSKKAKDLIRAEYEKALHEIEQERARFKARLSKEKQNVRDLSEALRRAGTLWSSSYTPPKAIKPRKTSRKYKIRVAAGDLHGTDQNIAARNAFLNDLEVLQPDEGVLGGDILNCSGTFSRFHRVHVTEFSYSYENDVAAGNDFLDACQRRSPNTKWHFLQGNHEARVDKWAAAHFSERRLAMRAIEAFGARNALRLDKRGIQYFSNNELHMGLHKPGIVLLGKCGYMHGYGSGKHVAYKHLVEIAMNIVHFHNHRDQHHIIRSAREPALGGWCPGCLCILQQYYMHETPTDHTHGYNLQFEDPKTKWFSSNNIGIVEGKSLLHLVDIK